MLIGAPLSGVVASFDLGWIAVLSGAASAPALGALWHPPNAPRRASVTVGGSTADPNATEHAHGAARGVHVPSTVAP